MHCTSCGERLKESARFCSKCGAAVADAGAPAPVAYQAANQQERAAAVGEPAGGLRGHGPAVPGASQPAHPHGRSRFVLAVVLGIVCGLALVAAILGIANMSRGAMTVAVTVPLEVPDLDEDGTRVPVEATGTDADGNEVQVQAYLAPDGTGLSLPLGTYEVRAVGSPISAKGVVYKVPKTVIEVVLDEDVVEAGQTQATSEALTFKKIARAKTTDEQIDEALEWAAADEGLEEGRAQELADAARTARDKAVKKAQKEAEEEAAEAEEEAEREANTIRVGNLSFLVPEGWRDGMGIERSATDVNVSTSSGTWVFTLDAGSPVYTFITSVSSPWRTIDLESGWRLSLYHGDDGAAIGEVSDAQGSWICEVTTMQFDGKEFGGGGVVDSAAGRAGQAAITDLSADADPEELWAECLRVCAQNISLSEGGASNQGADSDQGAAKDDGASALEAAISEAYAQNPTAIDSSAKEYATFTGTIEQRQGSLVSQYVLVLPSPVRYSYSSYSSSTTDILGLSEYSIDASPYLGKVVTIGASWGPGAQGYPAPVIGMNVEVLKVF